MLTYLFQVNTSILILLYSQSRKSLLYTSLLQLVKKKFQVEILYKKNTCKVKCLFRKRIILIVTFEKKIIKSNNNYNNKKN